MAYNNAFPVGYQPMYYPQYPTQNNAYPTPQNVNPTQPTQSGIIWVQGEAGAKSYLVAPNTTVQLWDSENQVIYLKSADASGMPSIKTLDYKIREASNSGLLETQNITNDYITKAEFERIKAEIEHIKHDLSGLTARKDEE